MIERRVVRRYATALFNAASKAGVVDSVESDLGLVSFTTETSPALMEAIRSPLVPASKKHDVLNAIFGDKVHQITLSYLMLLVDKRREDAIPLTEEEYVLLANEARGIITAEVVSAVKLSEDEENRINAKIALMTGKSVQLEKHVDPGIIGGIMVRIGDTVHDGSIKGQLKALRDRLLA